MIVDNVPVAIPRHENGPDYCPGAEGEQGGPHIHSGVVPEKGEEDGLAASGVVVDEEAGQPVPAQAGAHARRCLLAGDDFHVVLGPEMEHHFLEGLVLGMADHDLAGALREVEGDESGQELPGPEMAGYRDYGSLRANDRFQPFGFLDPDPVLHEAVVHFPGVEYFQKGSAGVLEVAADEPAAFGGAIAEMVLKGAARDAAPAGKKQPHEPAQELPRAGQYSRTAQAEQKAE